MSSDDSHRPQPPKFTFASPTMVTRRCNRCGGVVNLRGGRFAFCPGQGRRWVGPCCLTKEPVGAADQRRVSRTTE